MPNTLLTLVNVREEIQTALGSTGVNVELVPADFEKCLKEAVRKYNRHRPIRKRATVAVTTTQRKYLVDHPGLTGVVDLDFVEKAIVQGDVIDPFTEDRATIMSPNMTTGEYVQIQQYIEQSRAAGSTEPEWEPVWEGDSLYLYINVSYEVYVSYTYTMHVTPDNNTDTGMQLVPDGDTDWIIDYATAFAKGILALKRGKFGGILTPDGTESTVDASVLADDSKTEKSQLIEDIKKRRRPLPPVIG